MTEERREGWQRRGETDGRGEERGKIERGGGEMAEDSGRGEEEGMRVAGRRRARFFKTKRMYQK